MMTQVWAHRGASGYAPENTLPAFELAIKQNADGVELDVQMSKDGKLVVIHDEKIKRVTNGKGFVKDYTLKELKAFNCKDTFHHQANIKIPTLDEVLELLAPTGLIVNIELKTGIFQYPGIEIETLKTVSQWKMNERVIYSSFYHPSILKIKEIDRESKCGLLFSDGFINIPEYTTNLGVEALHPPIWRIKEDGFIQKCKKDGISLHVWHVNEKEHMKYLLEQKIEAMITDYPDKAKIIVNGISEKEF